MVQTTCHAHRLKGKPEQFGEEVFDKIFDIARISRFTLEERLAYEANMINKRDQYAIRMTAINEGKAEGRAEGRVEGMENVFALLEKGISLVEAKRILGL